MADGVDVAERNALVVQWLPLVEIIAHNLGGKTRVRHRRCERVVELRQEGAIWLIWAAERYLGDADVRERFRFGTYAKVVVKRRLVDYIRSQTDTNKIPEGKTFSLNSPDFKAGSFGDDRARKQEHKIQHLLEVQDHSFSDVDTRDTVERAFRYMGGTRLGAEALKCRFGIGGRNPETLMEMSERMGISKTWVHLNLKRARAAFAEAIGGDE